MRAKKKKAFRPASVEDNNAGKKHRRELAWANHSRPVSLKFSIWNKWKTKD